MQVHRREFFASTAALVAGGIIAGGVRTAVAAEAGA